MPEYAAGKNEKGHRLAVVFHFVIHCFSSFQRLLYQYSSSLKKFIYIDYQYIMQKTMKFAQTNSTLRQPEAIGGMMWTKTNAI